MSISRPYSAQCSSQDDVRFWFIFCVPLCTWLRVSWPSCLIDKVYIRVWRKNSPQRWHFEGESY